MFSNNLVTCSFVFMFVFVGEISGYYERKWWHNRFWELEEFTNVYNVALKNSTDEKKCRDTAVVGDSRCDLDNKDNDLDPYYCSATYSLGSSGAFSASLGSAFEAFVYKLDSLVIYEGVNYPFTTKLFNSNYMLGPEMLKKWYYFMIAGVQAFDRLYRIRLNYEFEGCADGWVLYMATTLRNSTCYNVDVYMSQWNSSFSWDSGSTLLKRLSERGYCFKGYRDNRGFTPVEIIKSLGPENRMFNLSVYYVHSETECVKGANIQKSHRELVTDVWMAQQWACDKFPSCRFHDPGMTYYPPGGYDSLHGSPTIKSYIKGIGISCSGGDGDKRLNTWFPYCNYSLNSCPIGGVNSNVMLTSNIAFFNYQAKGVNIAFKCVMGMTDGFFHLMYLRGIEVGEIQVNPLRLCMTGMTKYINESMSKFAPYGGCKLEIAAHEDEIRAYVLKHMGLCNPLVTPWTEMIEDAADYIHIVGESKTEAAVNFNNFEPGILGYLNGGALAVGTTTKSTTTTTTTSTSTTTTSTSSKKDEATVDPSIGTTRREEVTTSLTSQSKSVGTTITVTTEASNNTKGGEEVDWRLALEIGAGVIGGLAMVIFVSSQVYKMKKMGQDVRGVEARKEDIGELEVVDKEKGIYRICKDGKCVTYTKEAEKIEV